MSGQPSIKVHRAGAQPNVPPPMNQEQFRQAVANALRRISQTKGELFDVLGNLMNKEMDGMLQAVQGVYNENGTLKAENTALKKQIEDLEKQLPKPPKLQKTETDKK